MNFRNLETPSSMPTFVDFQKMRREKEVENIWRNHGQYFPKLDGKHQSTHPKSSVNRKQVRCTPQLIIVKLLKGRERILETAIKKSLSKYQGSSLKLTLTFLMISHQKSWLPAGSRICLKYWKERIVVIKNFIFSKTIHQNEGEIKIFPDKLSEFFVRRPTL